MTDFKPISTISLLTDFGKRDDYVGLMHARILGVNNTLKMIDHCHHVVPGNIRQAAFLLYHNWKHFPAGTVHLTVVDPGVGTGRKILGLELGCHFFIAPDNGILAPMLHCGNYRFLGSLISESKYSDTISSTFHGRDIFAPLAAEIASGAEFHNHFKPENAWQRPFSIFPSESGDYVSGEVMHIDWYGNLITNLPKINPESAKITILGRELEYCRTYGFAESDHLFWYIGSKDCVEIALSGGSAAEVLNCKLGTHVVAKLKKNP